MNSLIGNLNPVGNIKGGVNLPKGDKGDQGVSGVYVGSGDMPEGYNVQVDPSSEAKGVFPDLTVGVVETLEAGEKATASVTGPDDAPVLNLGIPKGDRGERGVSGVYVGEGDMPEGYSVQVNPAGDATTEKPWVLINNITLEKASQTVTPTVPANTYKELWIEGVWLVETTETSAKSIQFRFGRSASFVALACTLSVANGNKVYCRGKMELDTNGKELFNLSIAANYHYMGVINTNPGQVNSAQTFTHIPSLSFWTNSTTHLFGVGSTFKIWGR